MGTMAGEAAGTAPEPAKHPRLVIFISTCAANTRRRRAIRRSWFTYKYGADSPLTTEQRGAVHMVFVASQSEQGSVLAEEAAQEGDVVFVDAPEGYGHLWRKALVFLRELVHASQPRALVQNDADAGAAPATEQGSVQDGSSTVAAWWQRQAQGAAAQGDAAPAARGIAYAMHADDDSYVRLDLLLPLMCTWPRQQHYWGYIWDGTGARCTAPIRNPRNKSHMPEEQYELDYYPPFASGCGFVLSWDLVVALARAAPTLPDYRLLDPPFGIHLCGPLDRCILSQPLVPVHDERVRPYRPLPMYRPDTLVQHYMQPEEMAPFHLRALGKVNGNAPQGTQADGAGDGQGSEDGMSKAEQLYNSLVGMGLLRR